MGSGKRAWSFAGLGVALVAVAVFAVTAAANTGGTRVGSVTPAAMAEAKKVQAQYQKRPTQIQVTVPITKPIPTGKRIDFLTCASPGCVLIASNFKDAANLLGWKTKILTVDATADAINKAYAVVLRDKPDGVAVVAVSSQVVRPQLAKLQQMKVPVVTAQDPDVPFGPIIASIYTHRSSLLNGKVHADDMIASGCAKGSVTYIDVGGFLVLKFMREAFVAEAKRLAPEMKVNVVDIAATHEGTALDYVVGSVRAHPDTACIYAASDPLGYGVPQALKNVGVNPVPQLFGDFGGATTLQYLKSGLATSTNLGDSGGYGWLFADTLARHFAGQSVAPDQNALQGIWLVNKANAPAKVPYSIVATLKSQYKKLWGK